MYQIFSRMRIGLVCLMVLSGAELASGQTTSNRTPTPPANRDSSPATANNPNNPNSPNRGATAANRGVPGNNRSSATNAPTRNSGAATSRGTAAPPSQANASPSRNGALATPNANATKAATSVLTNTGSADPGVNSKKPAAPAPASGFVMRYKLKPGQVIHSEVEHLMKTSTKINETSETTVARTISQNIWEVASVSENGEMTFVHRIDSVNGSKQIGSKDEIRFDSLSDEEVHPDFRSTVEQIKTPLATITIDPSGRVTGRLDASGKTVATSGDQASHNLGMGEIAIRFPIEPIEVGHEWSFNRRIQVRRPDGTPKGIDVRELYKLEKVSSGVASITIRSEPLTPVSEPEIEAQIIQEMSNGSIKFDIDAGHLISKKLEWNQNVVGFSGPGSMIDYAGRFSEELKSVRIDKSAHPSAEKPGNPRR